MIGKTRRYVRSFFSGLLILLGLAACSQVSSYLDDKTGRTKDQRCQDYRDVLPFLELRQTQEPKAWRADLIDAYELFWVSNCAVIEEAEPEAASAD